MDKWNTVLTVLIEILKPTLIVGAGYVMAWLIHGKKKVNKENSEFVKDTFNNYDEMAAKYLERLDTHAEHIHRLQEALMKSRHDDGKKKMHIKSILEMANIHRTECNLLHDDYSKLIEILNKEYANG